MRADWSRLVPVMSSVAKALEIDGWVLYGAVLAVKLLFFLVMLSGRRAWRVQDTLAVRVRHPLLARAACLLLYLLLYQAVILPFSFAGYLIHHHYGIAVQSPGRWASDMVRGWLVNASVAVPSLLLLLEATRRWPRRWWLAVTAGAAVLSALLIYLAPLVLEPLFHRFTPLHDPVLRQNILHLADGAHVHVNGVFVGEFSSTTTEGNAYVTGLGSSQRIVLWDTILKRFPPGELQSIIAHELGHYALHHILKGLLLGILGSLLIFYLIYRLVERGLARGWIRERGEPATIVPIAALVVALNLLGLPVMNTTSRAMEAQADAFSLTLTDRPADFILSMQRLSIQDYDNPWPNPTVEFIFYSHPSIAKRIHAAVIYGETKNNNFPTPLYSPLTKGG